MLSLAILETTIHKSFANTELVVRYVRRFAVIAMSTRQYLSN